MTVSSLATYKSLASNLNSSFYSGGTVVANSMFNSYLISTSPAPSVPSTATSSSNYGTGVWYNLSSANTGSSILHGININETGGTGAIILVDILSMQGGLSGNNAITQTTNLPTAPLPRYTTGDGVYALITAYTAIGTTNSSAQITYTDNLGVSGLSSYRFPLGAIPWNTANKTQFIPLSSTGIRSVESFTLFLTTGTQGNLGISLVKPLAVCFFTVGNNGLNYCNLLQGGLINSLVKFYNSANLGIIIQINGTFTSNFGSLIVSPA